MAWQGTGVTLIEGRGGEGTPIPGHLDCHTIMAGEMNQTDGYRPIDYVKVGDHGSSGRPKL